MKIVDNYDLDNLVNDYGFEKSEGYNIYAYNIYGNNEEPINCCILVNTTEHEDRKLRFYYYDENDSEGRVEREHVYDSEGNYKGTYIVSVDCIDFDVEIPNILIKMIKDGIVEG